MVEVCLRFVELLVLALQKLWRPEHVSKNAPKRRRITLVVCETLMLQGQHGLVEAQADWPVPHIPPGVVAEHHGYAGESNTAPNIVGWLLIPILSISRHA